MNEAKNPTYIDVDELTVRIGEACMNLTRPKGLTSAEVVRAMKKMEPEAVDGFSRAALAATTYIVECLQCQLSGISGSQDRVVE